MRDREEWKKILYPPADTTPEGAMMCDEYYDARMKSFWRALSDEKSEEELEASEDEPILKTLVVEPFSPAKPKARTLVR